jgi:2-haloacid dehalogenase
MARRRFLQQLSSAMALSLLPGCALLQKSAKASPRKPIRAVCFDLFTLFDPRSVVSVAEQMVEGRGAELCEAWRSRQFEYAWLRVAADRYVDFRQVTEESLVYAARARGLTLSSGQRAELVAAYSRLEPWPDTRALLGQLKQRGLLLAPLANYAPGMLEALIDHAGMSDLFAALISTHPAGTFKPDPRAYALGEKRLGFPREQIAFSAFGGWDAAGARWFGYPTFWVNRLGVVSEELTPGPHASGPTLAELASFIASWA